MTYHFVYINGTFNFNVIDFRWFFVCLFVCLFVCFFVCLFSFFLMQVSKKMTDHHC